MTGMDEIGAERRRQIEIEGYSADHDDEHAGEITLAGLCYEASAADGCHDIPPPRQWPWTHAAWKPKTGHRDLVRAGALHQAEADRLERVAARAPDSITRWIALIQAEEANLRVKRCADALDRAWAAVAESK